MQEEEKNIQSPQKKSLPKKILKVIFYLVLSIVGLNVILYILLSIPAVQEKVISFALDKIKPIVKTEVSIDNVHINLFNHINLKGVYVEDQKQDTLLYTSELDVRINIWKLLANELRINSIKLDNTIINVSQDSPESDFNFQFLIDAFASNDTVSTPDSNPMKIALDDIDIKNARINYNVLSVPLTPDTFNVSHISISEFNTNLSFEFTDIANLKAVVESFSVKENSGLVIKSLQGEIVSEKSGFKSDKITLELPSSKLEIKDVKCNFLDNTVNADINTHILPADLLFFMPQLKSLNNNIILSSNISGTLPLVNIENLSLNYGEEAIIKEIGRAHV